LQAVTRITPKQAAEELASRDPVMAKLLAEHGPPVLKRRGGADDGDHFSALARSILYQQLAGKAAAAIHARFVTAVGGSVTAEAVLETSIETLRGAGLSGAKAGAITALADACLSGSVPLAKLSRMKDDDVVASLSSVRGIGPWTAQMFCMFRLGRLDVWPITDYGVRKGFAKAYGLPEMPSPKELDLLGEPFRPYRSVAAWYSWRAVETVN
jgi:DNA-3-methyladenine glycosylase II